MARALVLNFDHNWFCHENCFFINHLKSSVRHSLGCLTIHFDKILNSIRYPKSDHPPYKDSFWNVREISQTWHDNMSFSFGPGWVSCLDESMLPRTNKYTCPDHMCVPRKPWPLGNKYHSICRYISGLMYKVELVERKDQPR